MDNKQFDILLHDAEVKLKRLKALYEQWFQGVERIEPQVPRKDLDRLFQRLNKEKPRNTAARFKLQQLQARYNVYASYWQRIARQIEEGTYERDLRRARRRRGAGREQPQEVKTYEVGLDEGFDLDVDALDQEIADVLSVLDGNAPSEPAPVATAKQPLGAFSPFAMGGAKRPGAPEPKVSPRAASERGPDDTSPGAPNPFARGTGRTPAAPKEGGPFEKQPVTATFGKPKSSRPSPPKPPARPRPPPPPKRPGPPKPPGPPPPPPRRSEDAHLKRLYDAYLAARRRNNERVDNVRYDKMANSVQKMRSKLRKKHGDKKIDFEVVVQNGRVGLKPKID